MTVVLAEMPIEVIRTPVSVGARLNTTHRTPVNAKLMPSDLRFPRRVSTIQAANYTKKSTAGQQSPRRGATYPRSYYRARRPAQGIDDDVPERVA